MNNTETNTSFAVAVRAATENLLTALAVPDSAYFRHYRAAAVQFAESAVSAAYTDAERRVARNLADSIISTLL